MRRSDGERRRDVPDNHDDSGKTVKEATAKEATVVVAKTDAQHTRPPMIIFDDKVIGIIEPPAKCPGCSSSRVE